MKYIDRLKMSKDDKEAAAYELDNQAALNQLNIDLHEARRQSFDKQRELDKTIMATPFNTSNIIRIKREIAIANKTAQDIESLKQELFGEEAKTTAS